MMSFYTGRYAQLYDTRFNAIVDHLIETGEIEAKNPNKANSEAFRYMVNRFYYEITNNKIEEKTNKEEGCENV